MRRTPSFRMASRLAACSPRRPPGADNRRTARTSAYWGNDGLKAVINDYNNLYVEDDTPAGEAHYRARFYFNPNNVTMALTDSLYLFVGFSGTTTPIFDVALLKNGSSYQVVMGALSGLTLVNSSAYNLASGWNAIEIEYLPGQASLWVNGVLEQTLTSLDNAAYRVDSVYLGAMQVSTGTRGTVYFDDFDSRRFSSPGQLPPPGANLPSPTPAPGMNNKTYTYSQDKPHAVTALSTGESYSYDANGNTLAPAARAGVTCRVEGGATYNQVYNAENRLATVQQLSQGACPTADTLATANIAATWNFIYDGDGNRVQQEYFEGVFGQNITVKVTSYFAGGSYELDQSGVVQADGSILVSATTTLKYYSFAGQPVAMTSCAGGTCAALTYFVTDHLGSVVVVTDSNGALVSQSRYMPFGQMRTDVGPITQTDFGYTGQRNLDVQNNSFSLGLMDYHARFYDPYLNQWTQPDPIINPGPQGLNRYSYVMNEPTRYTDPRGYCVKASYSTKIVKDDDCEMGIGLDDNLHVYGVSTSGLTDTQKKNLLTSIESTGTKLSNPNILGGTSMDAFKTAEGFITVVADNSRTNCVTNTSVITCGGDSLTVQAFIHEFGHVFDNRYNSMTTDVNAAGEAIGASGWVPGEWNSSPDGYKCGSYPCLEHPASDHTLPIHDLSEEFADMFLNWVLDGNPAYPQNGFTNDNMGKARKNWMDNTIIDPNVYPSGIPVFLSRMGLR